MVPPPVPEGLVSEADTGLIRLSWNAVLADDLLGYRIYRTVDKDDPQRFVLLNADPVRDTFYLDTLPKNARNFFYYKVVSVDSSYNMSDYSAFAKSQMPDVEPPVKPVIIAVDTEGGDLKLRWIKNVEPDLLGYDLFRADRQDSSSKKIINSRTIDPLMSEFTDRWAEQGTTYVYFLQAIDSAGNRSPMSDGFTGIVSERDQGVVSEVSSLRHKLQKNTIQLRWSVSKTEQYAGNVLFRRLHDGEWKPLTGLMQEEAFSDEEIRAGHVYYYRVQVFDRSGRSAMSNTVRVTVPQNE